jgi:hypothetical protein
VPIRTIENNKQVDYKLVYGIVDGMPNSLGFMVVCDCSLTMAQYKGWWTTRIEKKMIVRLDIFYTCLFL